MTTKKGTEPTPAPASGDTDAIRTDIERTREDLGDTVSALADKADVKSRAKGAVADAKDRVQETAHAATEQAAAKASEVTETVRRRPTPIAAAASGLLAAVGTVLFVRRRRAKARARKHWWQRIR
jgi:ElaB/YqjD/DUF883 family membrane-anchored ribosome-binding protein